MTPPPQRWQVFGLGRVGAPLSLALHHRGCLSTTWTRSNTGRDRADALGLPAPSDSRAISADTTHVLVALPDDVVTRFCASLDSESRGANERVWLHTSGSLNADAFRSANVQGQVGSCHPLQSMTGTASDLTALEGAFFAVEGDPAAVEAATELALWFKGEPHRLRSEDKLAYHCAAVLASNGVYALLHAASRIAKGSGVASEALERSLARLAQQSAGNAQAASLQDATTGPVVRGDAGTVRAHLEHLRAETSGSAGTAEPLYRELARELLLIAESSSARPAALAAVAAVLEEGEA